MKHIAVVRATFDYELQQHEQNGIILTDTQRNELWQSLLQKNENGEL